MTFTIKYIQPRTNGVAKTAANEKKDAHKHSIRLKTEEKKKE